MPGSRMAAVSSGLVTLGALPGGFLDCRARDLHRLLDGPTLIELPGERGRPLFISILLHGNEDSGLGVIQSILRDYRYRPLPRPLMLLVGNVDAARLGLRRLDSQPDYNRIWPGTPEPAGAEPQIMAEVHARALDRSVIAAIDFHNNSGRNPHYAVVCNLDPPTIGLAALFSPRVVCFRGVPGTQTASFAGLIPAIAVECGQPGEAAYVSAGARLIDEVLKLDELPDGEVAALDLYHTLGVVRVREDVSFGFGSCEAEVRFDRALDEKNFRELTAGTVLAETSHPMPLRMVDEAGEDVAEHYFETQGGKLRLRMAAVPAMFTTDPRIVSQDCLCYIMERL